MRWRRLIRRLPCLLRGRCTAESYSDFLALAALLLRSGVGALDVSILVLSCTRPGSPSIPARLVSVCLCGLPAGLGRFRDYVSEFFGLVTRVAVLGDIVHVTVTVARNR